MMEQSDITLNPAAIDTTTVSPQVTAANAQLKQLGAQTQPWWEVGVQRYRDMRRNGEGVWPKPIILDGTPAQVPSRDSGRTIPIRIMRPDAEVKIKSVIMYIHGGGWVLMAEDLYDSLLKQIANGTDSLVVSVGYRLAPENPWPAGSNDCNDVADWLVDNAVKEYGASLQFIGGDVNNPTPFSFSSPLTSPSPPAAT
ncbi:MAG: hypothetical protein GOMPHAMPRED_007606 [Gomphillus americanus]|uniref:Alpha/beta hydrolase fold-3 domain-containing protein n=1 Tax=Gomphillus americanus TaxID=1940652 RepID=A0A8H3EVM1_9LECA|nr:MAG: hypothetical protein GOMPHAMPRED_007606 [Gomphillus americanus]